jgi:hypothetical protein
MAEWIVGIVLSIWMLNTIGKKWGWWQGAGACVILWIMLDQLFKR